MALKTVSQLRDSVAAMLSGVDLNNVDDVNGSFERAARTQIQKADIPEASNTQNITLYSGVLDYACDPRIYGTEIKDIRPQGISRQQSDYVYKRTSEAFDRNKNYLYNGTMATFEYVNGLPIIRIVSTIPLPKNIIDNMNATAGWVSSGTASSVIQDSAVYYQAPSSLRFNLTTGTGSLTKTINAISISSYEDVGVAFLAIRIPDNSTPTDITSIQLKLGSDSGNYDSVIQTTGFIGSWVAGNWLLVAFDFSTATGTGTPNWGAITYVQVSITTLSSQTNFRVGGLWISQPSPNQIYYQSAAIFVPSGSNVAQNTISGVNDTIILNDPAYNIYLHECALAILQTTSGGMGDAMTERIESVLNGARARNGMVIQLGLYDLFKGKNPTESLNTTGNYYEDNNGGSYG